MALGVGPCHHQPDRANLGQTRLTWEFAGSGSAVPDEQGSFIGGKKEQWRVGEYQKWLRIETAPDTPMLWVLSPKKQGEPEPKFESLADGTAVRVTLRSETEQISITNGQARITQAGRKTELLKQAQGF